MIVVTGAFGFIGSNLIHALNQQGEKNILAVDNLTNGYKFKHLAKAEIADYMDQEEFLTKILSHSSELASIKAIFHQGACSDTTEWDGRFMLQNNYTYSKNLLHYSLTHKIPFIYASSAAVYGTSKVFREKSDYEAPANIYGYSKLLFDQYVRKQFANAQSQIVGLRYFNVYGPHEEHKGKMASVAFHFNNQLKQTGIIKLFAGNDGYKDGEQKRDFVYIDDIAALNLWFLNHPKISGIFNAGTGRSQTFNDVADAVIKWHGKGTKEYIAFPKELENHYQSFTEANLSNLRDIALCDLKFKSVAEGVKLYLDKLNAGKQIL